MMTKLRGLTKWIFVVLIVAFLALMVFDWGASGSLFNSVDDSIGNIDGEKITRAYFNRQVSDRYNDILSNTGQNLDEQQMKELRNQVWESMIRNRVMGDELDALEIEVVPADISNYFIDNPQPDVLNSPDFQTNGRFDPAKYKEAIRTQVSPEALSRYEARLAEQMPFIKLTEYINASIMVTEQEIRDEFLSSNTKAKIEFIAVPATAFQNEVSEISDGDVQDFYRRNKKDFEVEEKRNLNYVVVSASPTATDSARIRDLAESLKERAISGADFAQMATDRSQDPQSAANGGDLGFFDKNTMVAEFSEAAFAAKPGDIVGPIQTRFGLHVIKIVDRKTEDGVDKVQASHILLKFEASADTRDDAYNIATTFHADIEDNGFAKSADKNELEVKKTEPFVQSKNGFVTGIGQVANISLWAFNAEEGALSRVTPVYTNQDELQSYVVAQVTDIIEKGYRPFEEVTDICRSRLELEKRKESAKEYAEKVQNKVMSANSFADLAAADASGKISYDSTDSFTRFARVQKIGVAPAINAAAFNLPVGGTSKMLETNNGYYFIRVKEKTEFNEAAFAAQKSTIRSRLFQQKSRNAFTEFYTNLKQKIDVEDRRYSVYTL